MRSLNSRMFVAAGLVLAAFLSTAAFTLDQAFRDTALTSVRERLTGRIYQVLGTVDLSAPGATSPESSLPDPALSTPESDHYAQILDATNVRVWNSRSMLGITIDNPSDRAVGEFAFSHALTSTGESLFILSCTILWEGGGAESALYTVQVAENERGYTDLIVRFRRSLWFGFFGIGVVLLLAQTVIFRWGMKPIRDVAGEVNLIEQGQKSKIAGHYPLELKPLTENLNALIRSNDSSVRRYINALGDLAHSLKTPLAVLRTTLERGGEDQVSNAATIE